MIGKQTVWRWLALALACLCPLSARADEPAAGVTATITATLSAGATAPAVSTTTAVARLPDETPIDLGILLDRHMLVVRLRVRYNDAPFVQMWQQFAESKFDSADKDHNGLLDAEEFVAVKSLVPSPDASANNRNAAQFNGRRRGVNNALPIADPTDEADAVREIVPEITRQEFVEFLRATTNGPIRTEASFLPSAASRALFKRLDTDHDDKLSASECERAFDTLHPLDLDDAELFTPNQLITGTAGRNRYFVENDASQRATPVRLAVKLLRFTNSAASLAWIDRIRQHFAIDLKASIPHSLNCALMLYDEATRAALDADGDGTLDQAELAHFQWRPTPNLDLIVDQGRDKLSLPSLPALPTPVRFRNGRMMQQPAQQGTILSTATSLDRAFRFEPSVHAQGFVQPATLTLGGEQIEMVASGFVAAGAQQQGAQLVNNLKQYDQDKNDYLEEKELRMFGPNNNFMALDANGDGKLYFREIEEYVDAQSAAASVRMVITVVDHDHALFESLDSDRDGRLARRELGQLVSQASAWDRDGDGQLTFDEVPRLYTVRVSQDQPQFPFQRFFGFNNFAANESRRLPAQRGPDWFVQMDRNSDGDISRREFLGTAAQFHGLDTDGDQLIDPEEANRAAAPVQAPAAEKTAGDKPAGEPIAGEKAEPAAESAP